METWLACRAKASEALLCSTRHLYLDGGRAKLFSHQSDEGAGLRGDRARNFDSISDGAGRAHYQQQKNHGQVGKYQSDEDTRLVYDSSHVRGFDRVAHNFS